MILMNITDCVWFVLTCSHAPALLFTHQQSADLQGESSMNNMTDRIIQQGKWVTAEEVHASCLCSYLMMCSIRDFKGHFDHLMIIMVHFLVTTLHTTSCLRADIAATQQEIFLIP